MAELELLEQAILANSMTEVECRLMDNDDNYERSKNQQFFMTMPWGVLEFGTISQKKFFSGLGFGQKYFVIWLNANYMFSGISQ